MRKMKIVKTILVSLVVVVAFIGLAEIGIPANKIDRKLIDASKNNDPFAVQQLLKAGADVDSHKKHRRRSQGEP